MRTRVIGLLLAVMAVMLLTAPPVWARTEGPMFGVSWTPDLCNNPYGIDRCVRVFLNMIESSNYAIDFAEQQCNGGNFMSCFVTAYTEYMVPQEQASAWAGGFWYGSEYESWIIELYENQIRDVIWPYSQDNGTCGAC